MFLLSLRRDTLRGTFIGRHDRAKTGGLLLMTRLGTLNLGRRHFAIDISHCDFFFVLFHGVTLPFELRTDVRSLRSSREARVRQIMITAPPEANAPTPAPAAVDTTPTRSTMAA